MALSLRSRNRTTALVALCVAGGMVGAAYAAVPLYRIFCQVTGYGGTTQVADAIPDKIIERRIVVRFNADVDRALPWRFRPEQERVELLVGQEGLAFFRARNDSGEPIVGTASFNVTPDKAGQYFNKVQCFCFTEQRLDPGQEIDMPVSFFVDPAIAADRNLDDVETITLSYTFHRTETSGRKNARAGTASPKTDG
jgi:cytochrome c oxidase assembly protein subunit 11